MTTTQRIGARAAAGLLSLCIGWTATAADWPQFLGPNRDGIAADAKGLLRQWPEGGPKQLWTVEVGEGFGPAAIHGDAVLLLDREQSQSDILRRLNFADGKEVWRYTYPAPGRFDRNGSRTTPATDGKVVVAIGPMGEIAAVNFADGKEIWKAHLLKDWDAKRPNWAVSTSPLLYGDWVIVAPWGSKAALVAYERATGKVVWTTPNPMPPPKDTNQDYSSPVPMVLDGKKMIVACGRHGFTLGVDAMTGAPLWEYRQYPHCNWHIPSPVILPDGRIFMTGGYGAGSAMFKVEKAAGGYKAVHLWANKNLGSHNAQALIYKDHIYGNSAIGNGLRCLTLDGEIKWDSAAARKPFDMGFLMIADGLIFIIQGKSGDLVMVEAAPDAYKELGRAPILAGQGQKEIWAPLAYSNGKLVIRNQARMVCLDLVNKP
jgi:outer membrane protein assembly factor BamB